MMQLQSLYNICETSIDLWLVKNTLFLLNSEEIILNKIYENTDPFNPMQY